MSNTQTLLDFYSALAKSMDMTISTDGTLMKAGDDDVFRPAEINGLSMVLPTSDVLAKSPWETKIAFHPLGEVSHMNQSPLLKGLTTHMRNVVLGKVVLLMSHLLLWTVKDATGNNHGLKTVAQKNVQAQIGEVTKAAAKKFGTILGQITPSGDTALISFKLSRRQDVNGTTYPRYCRVVFPLYKALLEWTPEHPEVWDVKLTQKEHDLFVNLFHTILPQITTKEGYSRGSQAQEAQWFDALIRSFHALLEDINKIAEPFKGLLPAVGRPTDLSWFKFLENVDSYAGLIPSLPNTQGTAISDENHQTHSANTGKVAPPPPPPAPPAQNQQSRRVDLNSIAPAHPPMIPPMGYPPNYPMNPYLPQMGQMPPMVPMTPMPSYPGQMPQGYPQPHIQLQTPWPEPVIPGYQMQPGYQTQPMPGQWPQTPWPGAYQTTMPQPTAPQNPIQQQSVPGRTVSLNQIMNGGLR